MFRWRNTDNQLRRSPLGSGTDRRRARLLASTVTGLLLFLSGATALAANGSISQLISGPESLGDPSSRRLYRQGFYLGLGSGNYDLDHNLDLRSSFTAEGLELKNPERGRLMVFGYGSGPHFTTEGRIAYSRVATSDPDTDVHRMLATIDFLTTVTRFGPLEPHVSVGFGAFLLAVQSSTVEEFSTFAVVGTFGGGLVAHLSRRFSLAADYRYAILNFEEESSGEFEPDNSYDVGGTGYLHVFTLAMTFDF
ncbi:MAG: hypothetical protein ABIF77_07505 [bacterium]